MDASTLDILHTKLTPTAVRDDRVSRTRLTEQLNASLVRPLILVSAPAGYGKSSLLGEWLESEPIIGIPVAWLSLDEDDNDSSRFLTYLIYALATDGSTESNDLLSVLHSPQPPPPKVIVTAIISRLERFPRRFVLVLDDYHVINDPLVHEIMAFFVDHIPPQLCLVISSREDPPFPLSRFRVRDQLSEIRVDDLRFTPEEAKQFLEQMLDIEMSADQIEELDARTEGWIAGLQLAALAMK